MQVKPPFVISYCTRGSRESTCSEAGVVDDARMRKE
jgi:hypothetical protein